MQSANTSAHRGSYEAAIQALNTLQSNATYIKNVRMNRPRKDHSNSTEKVRKFLIRSGMDPTHLDTLSVIHVTGTKGKGSTCAYCESILRKHGLKTGFFSSPHLINVSERIKIDGRPVDTDLFVKYFWLVYDNLVKSQESDGGLMPIYFEMLVLVAFQIFVAEKVDVAIVEVGIGGEYDSTNILRKVPVVGISSLGIDHTRLLGNTIESIAWHKSGIMKPGSKVFTVPQKPEAMEVLNKRSEEKNCSLEVVDGVNGNRSVLNVLQLNAALAYAMAKTWMEDCCKNTTFDEEKAKQGIVDCYWPGRFQILRTNRVTYYLDGAHTEESLQYCIEWFREVTKNSTNKKALIFNNTGDRNSENQFKILQQEIFEKVFFVPNTASSIKSLDSLNFNTPESEQIIKCATHKNIWLRLRHDNKNEQVIVRPTIQDAFELLRDDKYDLLITGSLHLVGASLSLLDPYLRNEVNDSDGEH